MNIFEEKNTSFLRITSNYSGVSVTEALQYSNRGRGLSVHVVLFEQWSTKGGFYIWIRIRAIQTGWESRYPCLDEICTRIKFVRIVNHLNNSDAETLVYLNCSVTVGVHFVHISTTFDSIDIFSECEQLERINIFIQKLDPSFVIILVGLLLKFFKFILEVVRLSR